MNEGENHYPIPFEETEKKLAKLRKELVDRMIRQARSPKIDPISIVEMAGEISGADMVLEILRKDMGFRL